MQLQRIRYSSDGAGLNLFRSSIGDISRLNLPGSIAHVCPLSSRQPRLFAPPSFRERLVFSRHLELRMRGVLGWYPWRGYYSQVRANRLLRPRFSSLQTEGCHRFQQYANQT